MSYFNGQKQAVAAIFEYIEVFYNKIRAHSTNGYRVPAEFKEGERIMKNLSVKGLKGQKA